MRPDVAFATSRRSKKIRPDVVQDASGRNFCFMKTAA